MAAALQHNKRGGKKKWHDSQKEKMKLTAVVVEKVLKKKSWEHKHKTNSR